MLDVHCNDVEVKIKSFTITIRTPPHLMKYAKLILILLKQLVDLNFDKSYMTKSEDDLQCIQCEVVNFAVYDEAIV